MTSPGPPQAKATSSAVGDPKGTMGGNGDHRNNDEMVDRSFRSLWCHQTCQTWQAEVLV